MKKIKSITALCILVAFAVNCGCGSMEENYRQYLEESNYSGKIQNLRAYPGIEKVALAWDNPKGQKSKQIKVVYGADNIEVVFDEMRDSVVIENLTPGTGYEFAVYTLDRDKNLSVPTYITAFPVSENLVERLTPPMVMVRAKGTDQYISVMGVSNMEMSFSGLIEYKITGPDGLALEDTIYYSELNGEPNVDIPVEGLIEDVRMLPAGNYDFDIKVAVRPIQGNFISIDTVYLYNSNRSFYVPAVKINLMTIPGTVSDQYNTTGGEGIEKLVDGDTGSKYLTRNRTTWMMWEMESEYAANTYVLTSGNDVAGRDPKDWVLEGSHDGKDWVELDKQTGFKFNERYESRSFNLSIPAYSWYRLTVTANNGDNLFQLAEWTLLYDSSLEKEEEQEEED